MAKNLGGLFADLTGVSAKFSDDFLRAMAHANDFPVREYGRLVRANRAGDLLNIADDAAGIVSKVDDYVPMETLDALTDTIKTTANNTDNVITLSQLENGLYGGRSVGSNPNAIINRQPGYDIGHNYLSYSDSMSAPEGFSDLDSVRDFKEGYPIRKVHHDAYFDPEGMDFDPEYDELVQVYPTTIRKNSNPNIGNSGAKNLREFMEYHYPQRYMDDDLPF